MNKYRNKKVVIDGKVFASQREGDRYRQLSLLQKAGRIEKLQTQVKYVLIPTQYEDVIDEKTGKLKRKCVERQVSYIADFVYFQNGKWIVEDVKGYRTPNYIDKRKAMRYLYGIKIVEI